METEYKVRLEVFEGPLDLLLYLIKRDEIDIYDISLERITQQYLEYLQAFKELNIDVAGEFVVMAASDEAELVHMVATAAAIGDRPSAFRYPRGEGTGVALPKRGEVLPLGKGRTLREGTAVAILSFGARLGEALKASDQLASFGLSTTVADARFAKPLDEDLVRQLASHHEVLIFSSSGRGMATWSHTAT